MKRLIYFKLFVLIVVFITNCESKEKPSAENQLFEKDKMIEAIAAIEREWLQGGYLQNKIYSFINKEIVINDNLAGQSFTIVQENGNIYINRKIFGSGVPYIGTILYEAIIESEHKIKFYKIIAMSENIKDEYNKNEIFELFIGNDIKIYINGMQLSINYVK
jgi:hypothetical protein